MYSCKPASECGLLISAWCQLPGLEGGVDAVMGALVADVRDKRLKVAGSYGLGPVADLPECVQRMGGDAVEGVARGSLQPVSDLRHGRSRRVAKEHMDMVRCVARRKDAGIYAACLAFEEGAEPRVHTWV